MARFSLFLAALLLTGCTKQSSPYRNEQVRHDLTNLLGQLNTLEDVPSVLSQIKAIQAVEQSRWETNQITIVRTVIEDLNRAREGARKLRVADGDSQEKQAWGEMTLGFDKAKRDLADAAASF